MNKVFGYFVHQLSGGIGQAWLRGCELPARLPACLRACLPARLSFCHSGIWFVYRNGRLPASLPACLAGHLPGHLPVTPSVSRFSCLSGCLSDRVAINLPYCWPAFCLQLLLPLWGASGRNPKGKDLDQKKKCVRQF